jgi:hypothetical protein
VIDRPREHHGAIERHQQLGIGSEGRQRPKNAAVGRQIRSAPHLEARDHRELLLLR